MDTPSPTSRDKTLTYIGDEWKDGDSRKKEKWSASVTGADGCIYGIPLYANRVVRFDPATKSLTSIGIDLGDELYTWACGVLADNGFVYSTPNNAGKILKIDTNAGATSNTAVSTMDIPDGISGGYVGSLSGDKAADGKLYFMPLESTHILRIDPNENDSMTLVGNKMRGGVFKYSGTVATPDGCIYGIPYQSKRIIKFDPANPDTTTTVGKEADEYFQCSGGVLARDGNIYAVTYKLGGILKIDVSNDTYSIINIDLVAKTNLGWGDPIRGHGDLLYFPPINDTRVMVFHTTTQEASLVGPVYSTHNSKWYDGALAPNGKIYSIPCKENHILEIDPSV